MTDVLKAELQKAYALGREGAWRPDHGLYKRAVDRIEDLETQVYRWVFNTQEARREAEELREALAQYRHDFARSRRD